MFRETLKVREGWLGQGKMEAGRWWKESGNKFWIGRGFRLSESIWFHV